MARDTIGRTFLVATILCVVCSVLVSSAAVGLRSFQQANKERDRKKNILVAAGLYDPADPPRESINEIYDANVEEELINLETGLPVSESEIDVSNYDPREASKNPELSVEIDPPGALPGIRRREKYAYVYRVEEGGEVRQWVLPIYGKGLWSTLYGFIALDARTYEVDGITFYEHAETPGLGGEVDNPDWQASWQDKEVYGQQGEVKIRVLKGSVNPQSPDAVHQIDGLSGATITTRGVSDMVRYWLGPNGFGPYLKRVGGNLAARTSNEVSDG